MNKTAKKRDDNNPKHPTQSKSSLISEDTVRRGNKWMNIGKDKKPDSGKFKTKKEADAQRAIWVNWDK